MTEIFNRFTNNLICKEDLPIKELAVKNKANLEDAKLWGANLEDAKLWGAIIDEKKI